MHRVKEIYRNKDEPWRFPLTVQYERERREAPKTEALTSQPAPGGDPAEQDSDLWELLRKAEAKIKALNAKLKISQAAEGTDEAKDEEEVEIPVPPDAAQPETRIAYNHDGTHPEVQVNQDGNTVVYGRPTRKWAGSKRPPHIWPEVWQMLSKKKKQAAYNAYQETIAAAARGDDTAISALAAVILDDNAPRMPLCDVDTEVEGHREKMPSHDSIVQALVARPVGKAEIAAQPKAQAALDKEWNKLVIAKVWNEVKPQEWSTLARAARKTGETIHVGRVFELCTEKGSELPDGDPDKKYKGRSVFSGQRSEGRALGRSHLPRVRQQSGPALRCQGL